MEPGNKQWLEEKGHILKEELAELVRRAGWFLVGAAITACVAAAIVGGVLLAILYSQHDRERQRAAQAALVYVPAAVWTEEYGL